MSLLMLVLISGWLGSAMQTAVPNVKPAGTYPFLLPGLPGSSEAEPKVMLWCDGITLVGVLVPEEEPQSEDTASQSGSVPAPTALLLRDGRCEPEGGRVSFGFLVPLKAWVYESPERALDERTAWLLHRFEGSVQAGRLKGVLAQVDVNHPGYAFREYEIEVESLQEEQASFRDKTAWRGSMERRFRIARSGP